MCGARQDKRSDARPNGTRKGRTWLIQRDFNFDFLLSAEKETSKSEIFQGQELLMKHIASNEVLARCHALLEKTHRRD